MRYRAPGVFLSLARGIYGLGIKCDPNDAMYREGFGFGVDKNKFSIVCGLLMDFCLQFVGHKRIVYESMGKF